MSIFCDVDSFYRDFLMGNSAGGRYNGLAQGSWLKYYTFPIQIYVIYSYKRYFTGTAYILHKKLDGFLY